MKYAHGGGERGGNDRVSTDKSVQCVGTDYKCPPQRFSPKSCETSRDFSTHCDCDCDCDCGSPDLLNTDQSQHQNSRTRSIEQALLSLPPSPSPSDTGTQPRLPHSSISVSDDPHDEESDIKSVKSNPRKRSSAESGYGGIKRIRGSTSDDGHKTSSLPSQTNDVMKQIDDLLPLLSSWKLDNAQRLQGVMLSWPFALGYKITDIPVREQYFTFILLSYSYIYLGYWGTSTILYQCSTSPDIKGFFILAFSSWGSK